MKLLNRNKKIILLLCALLVIAFVSSFTVVRYRQSVEAKHKVETENTVTKPTICQNINKNNPNECLFVGCNGLF